jgi:hypothetical protein
MESWSSKQCVALIAMLTASLCCPKQPRPSVGHERKIAKVITVCKSEPDITSRGLASARAHSLWNSTDTCAWRSDGSVRGERATVTGRPALMHAAVLSAIIGVSPAALIAG